MYLKTTNSRYESRFGDLFEDKAEKKTALILRDFM